MPTRESRAYYRMGYQDGLKDARRDIGKDFGPEYRTIMSTEQPSARKPKRKLSAWNKYVKANSKKPRFRYRNGKLNLKKMAVAFRKTPQGKKKRK
tara:strand:+ start:100 stop:384 length:285 start_codon:yes stop_codon:yes gene_type:complete